MLFLHSNGVGTSRAVRIYKTYGAEERGEATQNAKDVTTWPFYAARWLLITATAAALAGGFAFAEPVGGIARRTDARSRRPASAECRRHRARR
jgi:hypothetical protein